MCTKKTSLKIMMFYYSWWIQKYSKQMQEDVLLAACTEKLLKNRVVCTKSPWIQNFLNKGRTILYSGYVPKNVYQNKFFTTHGRYKTSRNKCRTKLYSRCVPKNFLKKLSRFLNHDGYKKLLNKGRTILYSGYVPHTCIKIKFFYYSRWIQNFS